MKVIVTLFCSLVFSSVFSQINDKNLINEESLALNIEKIDSLLIANPSSENHFFKGQYEYASKKYYDAIFEFDNAIELNANENEYYYWRGIAYNKLKDYKNAISDFDKCINLDSNIKKAYFRRAYSKSKIDDLEGAKSDYTFYLNSNPNSTSTYINRGLIYFIQKLYKESLSDFDKAIALENNNLEAIENRAIVRAVLGRKDAIEDFNKAVDNPQVPDEYYNRAIYMINYKYKGNYCADLKKALQLGFNEAQEVIKEKCK